MPTLDFTGNPLISDERALPSSTDFAGAPAGLSLSGLPQPSGSPLQPMPSMDMNAFQQQLSSTIRSPLTAAPTSANQGSIFYSASTGQLVVNGSQPFSQENASAALASEAFAAQPQRQFTLPDTASDWRAMPREEYDAYLNTIRNPSFGRRMGEAWEHAWRGAADVGVGAVLAADEAFTGTSDNDWAIRTRANIQQGFENNAPFMIQLRDVENVGDGLTYFSQMLVQTAPWIVETIVSMAAGAAIGGAVSGGVGAPAGAIEGFIAKEGIRRASALVLRQNLARGAQAYRLALAESGASTLTREAVAESALRTGAASADEVNQFFNFGERAYHLARTEAGGSGFSQAGMVAGSALSNYAIGVGDIRNTVVDAGADPTDADTIANIWGYAIPYAFVETMGDLLLTQPITQLFPGVVGGPSRLGNAGVGALINAGAEGAQEGSQYIIGQQAISGAMDQPINIDPIDLLESAVGGAIGGLIPGAATGALGPRGPASGATPSAPAPASAPPVTGGPLDGSPQNMGGLDLNFDPNDENSNYVGYQEAQNMRNNALGDMGPASYSYDGEGAVGGLDLDQDTNGIDPNYVGIPEAQAMRTNAISDIGPTTVTPPPTGAREDRTPEAIFIDITNGVRVTPQEYQIVRNQIRALQMDDPTNPNYTDTINFVNDMEAEQNTAAPYHNWDNMENVEKPDGLPTFGPHRLQSYRDAQGNPTGQAAPEYVEPPSLPNTDKLSITRDQMGRTKGITASMENVQKNITTTQDILKTDKFGRERQRRLDDDGKPATATVPSRVPGGKPIKLKRARLSKEAEREYNRMSAAAKKIVKKRAADKEAAQRAEPNPERDMVVDKFGADSHNAWRKNFQKLNPKEANSPRMRERGGAMVDINQPWETLDDRAKADNAVAAEAAYEAYKKHPNDIEAGSAMIHDEWIKRNKKDKSIDKALLEPYAKLSEEEKEKDRAHWRRVEGILNPPKPKAARKPVAPKPAEPKPNRANVRKAAQRAKEANDAIPERSPTPEAPKDEPRVSEETRSRDTEEPAAAPKSADDKVSSSKISLEFVAKSKAALLYLNKKNGVALDATLQQVVAVKKHVKLKHKINRKEQAWFYVNERPLTSTEVQVIIDELTEEVFPGGKPKKVKKPAKSLAKQAETFHSNAVDIWKENKGIPGALEATVMSEDYLSEFTNWAAHPDVAKRHVPAYEAIKKILNKDKPVKALGDGKGRPLGGIVTNIMRRELKANPNFAFGPVHPVARKAADKVVAEIHEAQTLDEEPLSTRQSLMNHLSVLKKRMSQGKSIDPVDTDKPIKAERGRLPRRVIDVRTPDGPSKIIVNPTRTDVMKMTRVPLGAEAVKYNMARFIQDKTGNLYVANGYYFIHDQIVDVLESYGINVPGYITHDTDMRGTHGEEAITGAINSIGGALSVSAIDKDGKRLGVKDLWPTDAPLILSDDKPIKASDDDIAKRAGFVTVTELREMVAGVQKRIATRAKFSSVHVYKNAYHMMENSEKDMLTSKNGNKYSMLDIILAMASRRKLENPNVTLSDMQWVQLVLDKDFGMRAGVLKGYDALIIFSDNIGNKRHAMETLTHEWIVHKGLRAIFPTEEARHAFLRRLSLVPGMNDQRLKLLAVHPGYESLYILDQYEEVLAFHSEEGVLGIEALLTRPEAITPDQRRSLWEEFKAVVAEFLRRVFNDSTEADHALDMVVGYLHEFAITGSTSNLMEAINKKLPDNVVEILNRGGDPDTEIIKALGTTTLPSHEETAKLLFGTETENPGRAYKKQNWASNMVGIVQDQADNIEKMQKLGRATATPIKEGFKALSREIETTNQMALRSVLIEKMLKIMHDTIKVARFLMASREEKRKYASTSATSAKIQKMIGRNVVGSTAQERQAYARLAIAATNHLLSKLTDEMIRQAPRLLIRHPDGTYTVNARIYDADGNDTSVFGKMVKQGMLTKEQFKAGVEQYTIDSEGNTTSAGVVKFTDEVIDLAYDKIYVPETWHMATSALETLEHATVMLSQKNNQAVMDLMRKSEFKPGDQDFANEALQRMYKLYADIAFHSYSENTVKQRVKQVEKARQVLVELMRTFHTAAKLDDWTDSRKERDKKDKNPRGQDAFKWREQVEPHKDVAPFIDQIRWFLEQDGAFDTRFARINSLGVTYNRQKEMLGSFQSLLNAETLAHEKENKVIQSILGNYVEMTRKGKWRVAIRVLDEKGEEATISPQLLAVLPAIYVESEREAKNMIEELHAELEGTHTVNDADGEPMKVTFDVKYGRAPGTQTMSDAPKIKEFLKVAELVGLSLNESTMKRITQMIEGAAERKRYGLQRAGSPGMDIDILGNNSKTMTRRAWEAAKTSQAWNLEATLDDKKNQFGDWTKLAALQEQFDIANRGAPEGKTPPVGFVRNQKNVYLAEVALLRYANQLRHMADRSVMRPTVNIRTTKGEIKLSINPEAEAHKKHALSLQKSLEDDTIELNLNDLLSKTGPLRQFAVVSQLGTVAAGIMNAFTPLTHLPWLLMAQHGRTGYGEGHEFGQIMSTIGITVTHIARMFKSVTDTASVHALIEQAKKGNNKTGLTLEELEFAYSEMLKGELMPQQTYSLTGGTESSISDLFWRNVSQVLLVPFSNVESQTRWVAAITTYRLAKQRYIDSGKYTLEQLNDPKSEAYQALTEDVERVINFSQGDYSNINRGRAMRGDLAQYIFQYKMFPLVTVLLINNLPIAQKAAMLGVLGLLAGVKGEPFADDFADIYDTLLKKMGFRHDSVELQLTQFFEEIMPGSSNWIMHGVIDSVAFGGTMSSRLSMGDILPLTGVLREEADLGREIENAFGPAYAANMDALEWAWNLTDFTLQVAGVKDRTMPLDQMIRTFPQGQVRSLYEAANMAATGQILDPRGRLTSDEVTPYNIFSRALGFYPLESSKANTAVRLDRMHTGYMRVVRQRYILAYANAYRAGNQNDMDRILDDVRDWNEAVEMTGQDDMKISNFRSAATRAGREAASTAIERTSRGAPDYSLIDTLAEVTGADTEADE